MFRDEFFYCIRLGQNIILQSIFGVIALVTACWRLKNSASIDQIAPFQNKLSKLTSLRKICIIYRIIQSRQQHQGSVAELKEKLFNIFKIILDEKVQCFKIQQHKFEKLLGSPIILVTKIYGMPNLYYVCKVSYLHGVPDNCLQLLLLFFKFYSWRFVL